MSDDFFDDEWKEMEDLFLLEEDEIDEGSDGRDFIFDHAPRNNYSPQRTYTRKTRSPGCLATLIRLFGIVMVIGVVAGLVVDYGYIAITILIVIVALIALLRGRKKAAEPIKKNDNYQPVNSPEGRIVKANTKSNSGKSLLEKHQNSKNSFGSYIKNYLSGKSDDRLEYNRVKRYRKDEPQETWSMSTERRPSAESCSSCRLKKYGMCAGSDKVCCDYDPM